MEELETGRPLVSVVILNWNGGDEVIECLRCIFEQTYSNIELVIVDNGSTDGSIERIKAMHPEVMIIQNTDNLGYARGMNVGIRHVSGKFVVLLNQDAALEKSYIKTAVNIFLKNETIGMVAGRVIRSGDACKDSLPQQICGMMMRWHLRPVGNLACNHTSEVFGPMFACAMIRRATLEDVRCQLYGDFFDEDYFAYHEDVDLCFRVILRGWRTIYSPELKLYHRQGSSTGGKIRAVHKSLFFQRHIFKNIYLTTLKDIPLGLLLWIGPLVVLSYVLLAFYLSFRSPKSMSVLLKAHLDVVKLVPKVWRRRRIIQANRVIHTKSLCQYFIRL